MSYILDSLKKSDQERKRGSVPGVLSNHGGSGPEPGKPRGPRRPVLLGGGVLILFLLALVVWLRPWQPAGQVAEAPSAAAPKKPVKVAAAPRGSRAATVQPPPIVQLGQKPGAPAILRPLIPPPPGAETGSEGAYPAAVDMGSQQAFPPAIDMNSQSAPPPGAVGWAAPRPGMSVGAPGAGGPMPGGPMPGGPVPAPGQGGVVPPPPPGAVAGGPIPPPPIPNAGNPQSARMAAAKPVAGLPIPPPMAGGGVPGERVVGGRLAGAPAPALPGQSPNSAPAALDEGALPYPAGGAPPENSQQGDHGGMDEEPLADPGPQSTPGQEPGPAAGANGQQELTPLHKMSPAARTGLPEIKVSAHFYSKKPASRLVSVNGRILREGQEFDGLKVEEITAGGVVFLHRGRKILVEVL